MLENRRIGAAIAAKERCYGHLAVRTANAGFAPRENEARRQPLDVPLKRPANRLVEIIQVEDNPVVERRIGAKIFYVRIAAQLRHETGVRMTCEIGRHDRHGAAKEPKRRSRHALILDRDEPRDAPAHGLREEGQRIARADVQLEIGMCAPRDLLARMTPKRQSFGMGEGFHGKLV